MNLSILGYASALVWLMSCNSAVENAEKKDSTVADDSKVIEHRADTVSYQSPETKITMTGNTAVIRGAISPGDNPSIIVEIDSAATLSLKLQPTDSNGNVRINQISMPDGKLDGPFGMSVDYPISQKGNYTVILGQNLMAGDPWTGSWVLTITIKQVPDAEKH